MADEKSCSRCEKQLDTEGYPLWCKDCRRQYNREYRDLQRQMGDGRGFLAGAEAMRKLLLSKIESVHPGVITNFGEVQRWIKECETPRP